MYVFNKSCVAASARAVSALSILLFATACSSSLTRFDLPMFGETTNSIAPPAAVGYGNSVPQAINPQLPSGASTSVAAPVAPGDYRNLSGGFSEISVREGDTLYSLSRRYGISERNILAANNLDSAADIQSGRTLLIPPVTYRPGQVTPRQTASRSIATTQLQSARSTQASQNTGSAANPPQHHVVESGDTAYSIARKYNITTAQLAARNNLDASNKVRLGQRLVIATSTASSQQAASGTPSRMPASNSQSNTTNNVTIATAPLPASRPAHSSNSNTATPVRVASNNANVPTRPAAQTSGALPEPEAMSSSQFRWPVRGRIISPFGRKDNGANNDGINISVPEGTSIKAAENGVVAYAGNELEGYGNLILIRHQNNFVTAYAHNSSIAVQRGDRVRRGQVIARAGQTGSVDSPQLHFEIRQASRPIDPIPHMAGS